MRPRQEGVNIVIQTNPGREEVGGSPPLSQEFLKSEGGMGGTSGALG